MQSRTWRAAAVGTALAVATGAGIAGATSGPAAHSAAKRGSALVAVLNGANELDPATLKRGAGDPNGRGSATILIDGTHVCFGIVVTRLVDPLAAHIHKGKRRQNGSIVVPLTQPTAGSPGASSGCVDAPAAVTRDIRRHPARYYVNVHTRQFGGGAIRGQLSRAGG
jgi:CHRD domain